MGRFLIIMGIIIIGVGLLIHFGGKLPLIGRLPGDMLIRKENFTFYFPLTTAIILSIVLSIIFNLVLRFFK